MGDMESVVEALPTHPAPAPQVIYSVPCFRALHLSICALRLILAFVDSLPVMCILLVFRVVLYSTSASLIIWYYRLASCFAESCSFSLT